METAKFLEHILSRRGKFEITWKPPTREGGGYTWEYLYNLKGKTKDIDYGCLFDKDGKCKTETKYSNGSSMCCCSGCSPAGAYLKALPAEFTKLKYVARLFDKDNGFWREGKGCILPRKYRSHICLTHRCTKLSDKDAKLMKKLYDLGV